MVVLLSEIVNFPIFYEAVKTNKLPISVSYKLSQLKKELDFHLNFYRETFQQIILDYAEKDEKGQVVKDDEGQGVLIPQGRVEECSQKIQELLNLKVEIKEPNLKISELEGIEISLEALEAGLFLLKE